MQTGQLADSLHFYMGDSVKNMIDIIFFTQRFVPSPNRLIARVCKYIRVLANRPDNIVLSGESEIRLASLAQCVRHGGLICRTILIHVSLSKTEDQSTNSTE